MLRDSVAVVAVVGTRPRAIPLAMITMRKSIHGFPFLSHMSMGLRLELPCYSIRYIYSLTRYGKMKDEFKSMWIIHI